MKVQIYTGSMSLVAKSGVGQAILHQRMMLSEAGVATTDKWEDEGPIHLNTVFPDAALTAILGCRLYERGGLRASAAMRAAFNVWTLCLFGLASSDGSVLAPLYALYHVSDAWFTGGNAGMTAGWGYVICAAVAAGIVFRNELSCGLARLRRRGA